jgi:hypothetical protein
MTYAQDLKTRICAEAASPSPVRAVIYARVSTDNESQKDSCSNQIYIAKKYLEKHPNIKLLHIFTDDGISGKNDYNRPAYSFAPRFLAYRRGCDRLPWAVYSRSKQAEQPQPTTKLFSS